MDTTVSPGRSRPRQDSEQPQSNKRTRCLRSCLNCRKAKQRCHLPDPYVQATSVALPREYACSRCQSLALECLVVDELPKSTRKLLRRSRQSELSNESERQGSTRTPLESPRPYQVSVSPRDKQNTTQINTADSPDESHTDVSSDRAPFSDLRIFDPLSSLNIVNQQTDTSVESERHFNDRTTTVSISSKPKMDWTRIGRIACRPFELLDHLLLRYSLRPLPLDQPAATPNSLTEVIMSVLDLRERYEDVCNRLHGTVAFLPSFNDAMQDVEHSDLLLGTILYLSCENSHDEEAKARILLPLRQRCFACILHSPRNIFDVFTLLIVALHLPLLFGAQFNSYGLDGVGLLTHAISASRSMELDEAVRLIANSYPHEDENISPFIATDETLRNALLWISLTLHAEFVSLAGDIFRQPIAVCSLVDLNAVQRYSDTIIKSSKNDSSRQRSNASMSILLLKARAIKETKEISQEYTQILKDQITADNNIDKIVKLRTTSEKAKEALQTSFEKFRAESYHLVADLVASGWSQTSYLDVIKMDLLILQFLGISRFTENLTERSANLVGPVNSAADLMKRLLSDPSLLELYVLTGGHRAEVAKHVLSLFINIVKRFDVKKRNSIDGISPPWSMSPVYLCSNIVMALEQMVEEVAGRIMVGHSLQKRVGDHTMETYEVLIRDVYECLLHMSNVAAGKNPDVSDAIRSGNFPALSASLTDTLLRTLMSWKSAIDRLAVTGSAFDVSTTRHAGETEILDSSFQLEDLSPQDFENIFQEFLSTPIDFFSTSRNG